MRKVSIVVTVFIVSLTVAYLIRDIRTYLAVKELLSQPHMSWAMNDLPVVDLKSDSIRTVVISAVTIAFEWLFLMVLPADEKSESDHMSH